MKTKKIKTIEEEAEYLGVSEKFERFILGIKAIKSELKEKSNNKYYGFARIYDNGAVYGIVKEKDTEQFDIVYKSNDGNNKYYDLTEVNLVNDFETDQDHALFLCILVSAGGWLDKRYNKLN